MKLFEHQDFEQAIIRAAEHFRSRGLRESIIEKDYFVTEALRIIDQEAGSKVIFNAIRGWHFLLFLVFCLRNLGDFFAARRACGRPL